MSVVVHRKPVDLTAWHLADQAEMVAALTALQAEGWRGGITFAADGWRLELNSNNADCPPVFAGIGDWLVLDMGLRLVSSDDVAANYDEAS